MVRSGDNLSSVSWETIYAFAKNLDAEAAVGLDLCIFTSNFSTYKHFYLIFLPGIAKYMGTVMYLFMSRMYQKIELVCL